MSYHAFGQVMSTRFADRPQQVVTSSAPPIAVRWEDGVAGVIQSRELADFDAAVTKLLTAQLTRTRTVVTAFLKGSLPAGPVAVNNLTMIAAQKTADPNTNVAYLQAGALLPLVRKVVDGVNYKTIMPPGMPPPQEVQAAADKAAADAKAKANAEAAAAAAAAAQAKAAADAKLAAEIKVQADRQAAAAKTLAEAQAAADAQAAAQAAAEQANASQAQANAVHAVAAQAAAVAPSSGLPSWAIPVGVVAVAVLLLMRRSS